MIAYIVKSTVCLAIILLVYLLAFEREKMHKFNRFYLLFGLFLSLIIPFLPSGEVIYETYTNSPILFNDGSSVVVTATEHLSSTESRFSWEYLSLGIYSAVLFFMLIRFVKNASTLIQKSYQNEHINYKDVKIILLEEVVLPHTFLGNIYVNEAEYRSGAIDEKLLAHEYAHATQRHSWDVLLIELVKAIFWFNPIMILYKRVIQLNHEFLADEEVLKQYNDVSNYQHLLVDTCQNNNQIYLASNINFLLTKKRLKMMTKKSSRKKMYMLMAGVVPVAIGLVMLLGQPVVAQAKPEIKSSSTSKPADIKELRQWKFMRGIGLRIPSSFSPNGDGKNERLITQTGGIRGVKNYSLTIYDKFGDIVFKSEDLSEGWNGKVNNVKGKPQGGVYVYTLWYEDSDGLEHKKNGEIKLIMDPNQRIPVMDNGNVKKMKITDIDTIPIPPPPPKANKNVPPTPPPPPEENIIPPPPPKAPNMKKGGIVPPPPPPPAPGAPMDLKDISDDNTTYWLDDKEIDREQMESIDTETIERVDVMKDSGKGNKVKVYSKSKNGKASFTFDSDNLNLKPQEKSSALENQNIEYILDGKIVAKEVIDQLDPDKIESVNVKKKEGEKSQIIIKLKG